MSFSLNSRIVDLVAPEARSLTAGRNAGAANSGDNTVSAVTDPSRRRRLLLALAGSPLVAGTPALLAPAMALASTDPTAGLQRWGRGEFRRFGFLVYEATLWADADPLRPPLALRLDYKRSIAGRAIAEASVKEMRQLGAGEAALQRWGAQMAALFPDVRDGDHIVGVYRPDRASFLFNGRPLGDIADPEFARRFFAIWLDPQTSAPELRAALLKRSA